MNLETINLKSNLRYVALLIFILLTGCFTAKNSQVKSSTVIIKNINVIDVINGRVLPNQDVVIKDKAIYFIGNRFSGIIPSNSTSIDGTGKYLSPGLWDMHFHLCWDKNNDTLLYPILLKNGIMGIRDMGGDLDIMKSFKKKLASDSIIGPEIYGAGPIIDGNPPVYYDFSIPVDDKSNIPAILDSLKTNGSDFFKTYSLIREPQLKAISNYCLKHNMTFAGHLSEYIQPEISISYGQKSIEHLNRLDEIWQVNKSRIDSIAQLMLVNHTCLCPTLITYQLKTRIFDTSVINHEYAKFIPASLMKDWKVSWEKRIQQHSNLSDLTILNKVFEGQMELVNHLHKMGVMILAGSDFGGMPYVYPGISLYQELRLMVDAGLSNIEALKTATINPAIYLSRQENYGSLSVGKYADMIILEHNPFDNIDNLKTIITVIVKGKILNDLN